MVVKTIALSPPFVSRPFICPPIGGKGRDWENLCCALEEELRPHDKQELSQDADVACTLWVSDKSIAYFKKQNATSENSGDVESYKAMIVPHLIKCT